MQVCKFVDYYAEKMLNLFFTALYIKRKSLKRNTATKLTNRIKSIVEMH